MLAQTVPLAPLAKQTFWNVRDRFSLRDDWWRRERFHKGAENAVHAAERPGFTTVFNSESMVL